MTRRGLAAESEARCPREGLSDLARQPGLRGIWGDIEMNDFSSLMAEDDQGVEKLKRCSYDNEHVDGGGVMAVIVQERAPGWGGGLGPPRQVSADRGLADHDAELEQLAMNAGRAPEWVCLAHLADQITDLAAHSGPPQMA
jgi:hypothetical protein